MTVYLLRWQFCHMKCLLREEMVAVEEWRVGEPAIFPIEDKEMIVLYYHVPWCEIGMKS